MTSNMDVCVCVRHIVSRITVNTRKTIKRRYDSLHSVEFSIRMMSNFLFALVCAFHHPLSFDIIHKRFV